MRLCWSEKLFAAEAMLSEECRPDEISSLAERKAGGLSSVRLAECLWPLGAFMALLFALRPSADLPPTDSELDRVSVPFNELVSLVEA